MYEHFERRQAQVSEVTINYVIGGSGPPLLLLHGYPQTHAMWHKVAPVLAKRFTVVVPDLRGYGDSSKPVGDSRHERYAKRTMARDQVELMTKLGFTQFAVAGHDRGARVTHRMILDHPARIERAAVLDIIPTYDVWRTTNKDHAWSAFHWYFLSQQPSLPETMIGANPDYWLTKMLENWGGDMTAFTPDALAEYLRCFRDPATIHATCEDYRAGRTIDVEIDATDLDRKVTCPLLVLWGEKRGMARAHDVLGVWRSKATDVRGRALVCGHFLPEEAPAETADELLKFFAGQ
ncbi:MAG: alpha/beta hydrolase [Alphaproteobacteria bacterium]|nr:alpha/beta hydrolase [Alphaproteobacteria bacterium]